MRDGPRVIRREPTERERAVNAALDAMRRGFSPAQACFIGWGLVSDKLIEEFVAMHARGDFG